MEISIGSERGVAGGGGGFLEKYPDRPRLRDVEIVLVRDW